MDEIKAQTEGGKHLFEVVSLFAGGGGSSTGYRMAGGKVLAVNEFIPEAVSTYSANWPDTKIIQEDVRQVTPDYILELIGKNGGELDILDGSPPCSAFSTAGSRSKGWGKSKKYSDSQQSNVEDLFFEYIRILNGIQPKVFIAENVAGLAKGVAKGYLNQILRGLRECGYQVECKILNAKWLGIPQSRQRTIFVGVRNDLWKDSYKGNLHPSPLERIVKLKDALDGLTITDQDVKDTLKKDYASGKLLMTMRPGERHKKRFSLSKGHPDMVSDCITATCGDISAANPCHWDNRAFSVREIKRIMSLPDDYILTGDYRKQVERAGRMVPPFMMRAVASHLLSIGVLGNANT